MESLILANIKILQTGRVISRRKSATPGGSKPPSLQVCKQYLLTCKRAVLCGNHYDQGTAEPSPVRASVAHPCKGTLGDKTPQSSDSVDPTVHMSMGNSPDLSPQERELPPRNAQQSLENSSTKQVCQVCKCHVHRSALKELCIGSLQTRHHVVRAVNAHPQ